MTQPRDSAGIETGVRNLDAILGGGLPAGTVSVIAGPPGAGKTILTQQIVHHHASPERRALYFSTLSEPTAKTLRYLRPFSFFDAAKLEDGSVQYIDVGTVIRNDGIAAAVRRIVEHVAEQEPSMVVIDSFKVFSDLARSLEERRTLTYELVVELMAWEVTALLLGEFGQADLATDPLLSIVDGLLLLDQGDRSGEQQRFIQLVKMRGADHRREPHSFAISSEGIEVFAPRVTMVRRSGDESAGQAPGGGPERLRTGIDKLDELVAGGIPLGSSLLVAGVAGTGKTVLSLEFLYRGAQLGQPGILFSFEETEERLRSAARGLGWDLDAEIARGMIEVVFIPQPEIGIEAHLVMMQDRVRALGARRVVLDSLSVFLHRVTDPRVAREKTFQLASIVQNAGAVGLFATDIPYGAHQISRFGVEETVVDGVVLLSSRLEGHERHRYLEVYKLRNTSHSKGRHSMTIGPGGIRVYPRYHDSDSESEPVGLVMDKRVASGIAGLDDLLGGGLLERSVTLLSGSAGIGKTTFASQFLVAGAPEHTALFVAFEEGPSQIVAAAGALGVPLAEARERGQVDILYLSRESVRPSQLLSVLEDRVKATGARRVVLDGLSHLTTEGLSEDALRLLIHALVARLKQMNVTTLLTFESSAMYSTDRITDRRFSPVADNLIVLRYTRIAGELQPTLTIVKTRGSQHDFATYTYSIDGTQGIRMGRRCAEGLRQDP